MVRKIIAISIAIAIVISAVSTSYVLQTNSQKQLVAAQSPTLRNFSQVIQFANTIHHIYPQIIVVNGSMTNFNGIPLKKVATNSISDSPMLGKNGAPKPIFQKGLANATLYRGVTTDEKDIVVLTINNTGTSRFSITILALGGQTNNGLEIFGNSAIDSSYDASVWGNHPKPTLTKMIVLDPNQLLSEYIVRKWVEPVTNQTVTMFGGSATFLYDKPEQANANVTGWHIGVIEKQLITGGYSNSTAVPST